MTITSSQYILVMWSLALYVIESLPTILKSASASDPPPPFVSRILSIAISHVSGTEEMTPWPIYRQLAKGIERLLLLPAASSCLSPEVRQTLTALSLEQCHAASSSVAGVLSPPPRRVLAAVALLLSSMYSNPSLPVFGAAADFEEYASEGFLDEDAVIGRDATDASSEPAVASPNMDAASTPLNPAVPAHMQSSDPEALVAAMEKATVLFDHLRKSSAGEAHAAARFLPHFLLDFFQPQDVMNKLIAEFLSHQQPHPQLLARCLFRLFGRLLADGRGACVTDWVAISLGHVVARSPVAMATWSATCCFVAASRDVWLRRTFPLVVDRVGQLEEVDTKLFRLAARNFFGAITDVGDQNAFKAAFRKHRDQGEHYRDLLRDLGD